MTDAMGLAEAKGRMGFIATIMKVCLDDQVDERGEDNFVNLAQKIIENEARREERNARIQPREMDTSGWTRQQRRTPRLARREQVEIRPTLRNHLPGSNPTKEVRGFRRPGHQAAKKCYTCGQTGHLASSCRKSECFECGNRGHFARECPYIYRRRRDEPMETDRQVRRPRSQEEETDEESVAKSRQTRRTYREVTRGQHKGAKEGRAPPIPESDFEDGEGSS